VSKSSGKTELKIALSGANGRMGQEVQALAKVAARIEVSADWKTVKPAAIEIVIDFSSPAGLEAALEWCVKNQKPLVSGTTGLSGSDRAALKKAAQKIPLLYSANMSLGIAALMQTLETLGNLKDWDFQIEETHHSQKKDRPSGTGLLLQEKLQSVLGRKLPAVNSIRGGGIPGIHEVLVMGPDESLVLQHTAFNRKVFAQGALRAARWLFDNKSPGLYDLSDLYKID
jgi:4-hydroxy-tetrahydrodipicolinate reductase